MQRRSCPLPAEQADTYFPHCELADTNLLLLLPRQRYLGILPGCRAQAVD